MSAKRQHFVPQFLLRYFATDSPRRRVWALDKRLGTIRQQSIREVAHENFFYEHPELKRHGFNLEERLAALESLVAPTIADVVLQRSLLSVGEQERRGILDFALVQLFRTRSAREYAKLGSKLIFGQQLSEDNAKKASLAILLRDFERYRVCVDAHILTLRVAGGAERFILGDSVASVQRLPGPKCDSLTTMLPVAIVTMPLSPDLCVMLFPANAEIDLDEAGYWYRPEVRILNEAQPALPEDVETINAASAFTANRFVFSATEDFADVQRLLRANPGSIHGPVAESAGLKWPETSG
jgi:hypothetical protein